MCLLAHSSTCAQQHLRTAVLAHSSTWAQQCTRAQQCTCARQCTCAHSSTCAQQQCSIGPHDCAGAAHPLGGNHSAGLPGDGCNAGVQRTRMRNKATRTHVRASARRNACVSMHHTYVKASRAVSVPPDSARPLQLRGIAWRGASPPLCWCSWGRTRARSHGIYTRG